MRKIRMILHQMIQKHYEYTGSTVAKFILDDFENQLKNFVKVFPKDYKKALQSHKRKGNNKAVIDKFKNHGCQHNRLHVNK